MRIRWIVLVIAVGLLLAGWAGLALYGRQRGEGSELTVSAAASLRGALTEAAGAYSRERPGVRISLNFGSSGSLKRQIEQGAPVDVFISAATREMDDLEQQGLIYPGTRRDLAGNRIVLVVAASSPTAPSSWEELAGPAVRRLAVGIPEAVPVGQYAKETLQHMGLWEKIQPKLVLAKDVLQVVSYVKTGNVDAGVVFLTDSRDPGLRVVAEAPAGSHQPVVYTAAVLKSSRQPEVARDFLAFLTGPDAAAIFRKYGFTLLGNGG